MNNQQPAAGRAADPTPLFSAVSPASGLPARQRAYQVAAGLFFLLLALVLYGPSLSWLPRGIHEWAQADRLSLAISFYDNGLRLFRPQTLNLASYDGVTGVEFPLVPYLAALGAKLTGRASLVPWYRSLTAAAAWLSYVYLFRLVFERTRHFAAALLPGVFLATSPVFAYYAGNFLPDPTAAALTLVAAYYLLRYAQWPRFADLVRAIAFFTLATLIKTSAAIYLLAALGTVAFWSYLQASLLSVRRKLLFLLLAAGSLGVVVGYALFNRHLNAVYHSNMFLATTRPIETPQQYDSIMTRIRDVWQFEYFTKFHYFLLKASAVICLLSLPRILRTQWLWAAQLGLAAVGGYVFFRLFGLQLPDHDYYVLAPYWPALTLLVALAAVQLATWQWRAGRWRPWFDAGRYAVLGGVVAGLLVVGVPRYRARTGEPYRSFSNDYSYHWMQGGAAALRAAHVPATATILVMDGQAPNLSLVYFDRRGLVWQPDLASVSSADLLGEMATRGLDYLIIRPPGFDALAKTHPDVLPAFRQVVRTPQYVVLGLVHPAKHW